MDFTKNICIQNCQAGRKGIFSTVIILGVLIASALLAYSAFGPQKDHRSIRQIAIIFRHGAKTPSTTYANDPHKNYNWENGWDALTREGMLQLYHLGEWIQRNYGQVIGKIYQSSKTYIKSSYADRCIMSAQSLLAAVYNPEPEDMFLNGLPWRPVPVHSIPRELDKTIVVKHPCPRLEYALNEAYVNESRISDKDMANYYAKLAYHTGQSIKTITDVEFLYNTLMIEEKHGLTLPEWTKKFYNEQMRHIAMKSLAIFTSNTLQRRLRGGPLLKEITDNMMQARNGQNQKKLYLYAAHDITIVNVLRAMGFTNELFLPDYGATLIFELVLAEDVTENDTELDVKIKYLNNTNMVDAYALEVPGCKEPCKLLDLLSVWRDVIPVNWDSECIAQ